MGAMAGELRRIVDRASTLNDRLSGRFVPGPLVEDAGRERLRDWRQVITNGEVDGFSRRLTWDAFDEGALEGLLSGATLRDGEPAPGWTGTFRNVFGGTRLGVAAAFTALDRADRALDPDHPLPFQELMLPLIAHARSRIARAETLPDAAMRTLERALLQRLTGICAKALYADFAAYRAVHQQMGAALHRLFVPGGTALYEAYLDQKRRGALLDFFREFSVAARLCSVATDLWVEATSRFVRDLEADAPEIQSRLGNGTPLGGVAALVTGVSDPHLGGRSVVLVEFDSGLKVAYKPRPLGLEHGFGDVLDWLNAHGGLLPLRPLRLVPRDDHGWSEFVAQRPCQGTDDVERFYRRCGMLLCIAYVLNGSDLHIENVIADGEHPVLIDLEALMGPRFDLEPGDDVRDEGVSAISRRIVERSVLRVHLLPMLKFAADGQAMELGGVGGLQEAVEPVEVAAWRDVNRDSMQLGRRLLKPHPVHNQPVLDGVAVDGVRHVPEILEGFEHTYRLVLAHRDAFLASDGLLSRFAGKEARFLFRNSSLYGSLLERTLHPSFLRDGADHSIQFEALARPLVALGSRPPAWRMLEAERASLEQLDLPLFTARVDSRSLGLPTGEEIPDFFQGTALDEVRTRLSELGEADLALQRDFVRAAFAAVAARELRASFPAPAPDVRRSAPASFDAEARGHAIRVAEWLRARAVVTPKGEAAWFSAGYSARARRHTLAVASGNLLDGNGGIAVFLAALERATGGCGFRDLALAAARPLHAQLEETERYARTQRRMDLGGGTGLGSAVYALVRVASLLEAPELLAPAQRLAALVTPETIASDATCDVVGGSAGAILALLALHGATHDATWLARADACGRHLLARRVTAPGTDRRVWTARDRVETGFAHGQAGIALALLRLFAGTGEASFRDAAREAVAYEREALGPDLLGTMPDNVASAWSHGAVGIALARLGGMSADATAAARADVEAGLALGRADLLAGTDDLCCGVMGRVDLLLEAALRLDRPALADAAHDAARSVLSAAARTGSFRTGWGFGYEHPGLLRGAPGIAYELLRLIDPERIPSVLLWN